MEAFFLKTFNSYEEFKKQFFEWQDKYFQIITIEKSTKLNKLHSENVRNSFVYDRVIFKCKHGGDPRSGKKLESSQQGARNSTHSGCINCPWKATLVYNKPSNCLKFTQKELVHEGHTISKETYNAYADVISRKLKQNQEAMQLQQTLDQAKTSCYNQVTTLNDKFGFNLSTQDIFNHKLSQKPNTTHAQQLWEEIQLILQENPNSVKLSKNINDEIECIFIQTSFMREMYLKHPEIHHIDSTFKVNVENFQLYISMVVDPNGNGVPAGYCFMKSACKENIEFFYQQLSGNVSSLT